MPVELSGLHLHAQQQVGEVREVHVSRSQGVQVHGIIGVYGLNVGKYVNNGILLTIYYCYTVVYSMLVHNIIGGMHDGDPRIV